jgi:hypothetical protein
MQAVFGALWGAPNGAMFRDFQPHVGAIPQCES